ncbi:ABC transporter permease [Deinococcus metallilatus]|uniref:ABC transporter permease n=1 Tax=Deinococcus metallilatus TaxID=1211322 RepID=A0AAJ5F0X2_9DEIO|nr:ABC transporter permease [Deinococcus metallilatus]MBB5295251.1 lipoprotein-releasing system permease protein [Deinococcus metallilatus]QBY08588.1 ABC transporter permease [Deinococcus metallilatus]RXJ10850.1 ABC transporter permease [Deinococcus metallilatus]TLK22185.1 ABC transporter permease [Deinococcus metallilatus]GMA15025.1 ABC transporter permease [Deinococcus metallilatus]
MASPSPDLAWTLARAHLSRRRTQNLLTILGIAVGVMVLIAALSLTNGFTRALVDATLRASPHLSLVAFTPTPRDPALEAEMRADPHVLAFVPFLGDKGLLTRPARQGQGAGVDFATLFGVTPGAATVLQLAPQEAALLRTLGQNEVLLGAALARNVGAFTGDEVRLLNSGQRRVVLRVKGVFNTGNYLIDSGYAFTSLGTLQALQGTGNISGYQLRLRDPDAAPQVGNDLTRTRAYTALPWQSLYGTLLDQLALQKRVIAFVVFLIVIVAAFGIANVLTLAVFEKTQEIAILRAIGATRGVITRTFLIEGALLGLGGLLLGNLLGLGISAYFTVRPFQLPGDLYFITALPVEVRWTDLLWVNAVGLGTTLLAALIPARRAANVEPARIIR